MSHLISTLNEVNASFGGIIGGYHNERLWRNTQTIPGRRRQRHIAKTLGISRNTVAKYCEGAAVPWERKTPERVSTILTDETVTFIRSCLEEDKAEGLKKQRHTAKRIYDRLVEETGFTGGESTVRAKVHELKQLMPSVFLPLLFDPGEALQVDWGEAFVYMRVCKNFCK